MGDSGAILADRTLMGEIKPIPSVAVAIPTYGRDDVLLNTVNDLLALDDAPDEILIIDQTPRHSEFVEQRLQSLDTSGAIRWLRLPKPSITVAMNTALCQAQSEVVLFLDDDIRPDGNLVAAHRQAQQQGTGELIAGRVLQPWHKLQADPPGSDFRFNSLSSRELGEFMGGNFSVRRELAVGLGGFDENFVEVAYRFEAEFALRWCRSGRAIRYEPTALIHHLKEERGGTRTYGDFLRTWRPSHSIGEYYFLMTARPNQWRRRMVSRLVTSFATRHHLRRPWWIPAALVSELRGMVSAYSLVRRGPRLIKG